MRGETSRIIDAVKRNKRIYEADACLVIAATSGGTGSGGAPVLIKALKETFTDKPVYALLVLPFEHEENNEQSTVFNTAVCLKSTVVVADAVILFDNQRFVSKDSSVRSNMQKINQAIAEPFFNLLCSGEERRPKSSSRPLGAGDIIASMDGWTAVGYGKAILPLITLPKDDSHDFVRKEIRNSQGIYAMNEALAELSFDCRATEAYKALYLVSGPRRN
jgi:cell division GTPase FtsZ